MSIRFSGKKKFCENDLCSFKGKWKLHYAEWEPMPDSPGRGIARRSTEGKNSGSIPAWRVAKAFGEKAENAETRLGIKHRKIDVCYIQANTTKLQNKPNVCVN